MYCVSKTMAVIPHLKTSRAGMNIVMASSAYPQPNVMEPKPRQSRPVPELSKARIMEDIRLVGRYLGYRYEANTRQDYWQVGETRYRVIADADDRKYLHLTKLQIWIIQ